MDFTTNLTPMIIVAVFSLALGWFAAYLLAGKRVKDARKQAEEIESEARRSADRIKQKEVLKAKEDWYRIRDEQEGKLKGKQRKLDQLEKSYNDNEKKLARRENELSQKESGFKSRERDLAELWCCFS